MNRDPQSLLFGAVTLAVGAMGMVLTTSWVWPGIALVLGVIGFGMALTTPAREPRATPPPSDGRNRPVRDGEDRLYFQGN